jgi:outer membrane protein assembly complex protein YaeT
LVLLARGAALLGVAGPAAGAEPPAAGAPVVTGIDLDLPPGEDRVMVASMLEIQVSEPLSLRSVRRTVEVLYQLGRFSNVVVREVPAGEGKIRLRIECLAKRRIKELRFSGDLRLPEEQLRRLANLPSGEEFYAERLGRAEEAIRAAFFRLGWREARVEAKTAGDAQVAVTLAIAEGAPTQVASVTLAGRPGIPERELVGSLRLSPGSNLDLDALDEDIRTLRERYRTERYWRARVGLPTLSVEARSAALAIPVEAGPQYAIRFEGESSFSPTLLRARLGYDGEATLDDSLMEEAAGRLRDFYRAHGFFEARVTPRELSGDDGRRSVVVFHVQEGRRFRVAAVRFRGTTFHDEAWMKARLFEYLDDQAPSEPLAGPEDFDRLDAVLDAPHPARSPVRPDLREHYDEAAWQRALERVMELFKGAGFLEAAVQPPRIAADLVAGVLELDVDVKEGPRTFVESIGFEGNKAVALGELRREARFSPSDPLSFYNVEETRVALLNLYARRGYLFARVEDFEQVGTDKKSAAVIYRVEEGPKVRIQNVVILGLKRTREDVVRSTLAVHPGETYDPDAIARSQTALLRLNVFRAVALRLNDPERPEASKDLYVDLTERDWQTLTGSVGASVANGPRVQAEYGRPNLFGSALEGTVNGKLNYAPLAWRPDITSSDWKQRLEGRATVGFHYPRIYGLNIPLGARVDLIGERLNRRAYDLFRTSGIAGLDLSVTSRITLSLQGELEWDYIQRSPFLTTIIPTRADLERLRYPEGATFLRSVRPVLSFDYRDNSANPRRGWLASGFVDLAHTIGDPDERFLGFIPGSQTFTDMFKTTATVSGYLPIGKQSVLAVSVRGGRIFALDPASQTPGPKRFYMGGASSMRGYAEDAMVPEDRRPDLVAQSQQCATSLSGTACSAAGRQIQSGQPLISEGGEAFALVKTELRFPVQGSLEGGVFVDAGNLWLDPKRATLGDLRTDVGFGLRFVTPIGPATFDVGFHLQPDTKLNERVFALADGLHFSIGLF